MQIPLVWDNPKVRMNITKTKSRTLKGMRRYIKTIKLNTELYFKQKNEYSQVKSLMNTQYGADDGT